MVVARHATRNIERIGGHLKSRATTFLADAGLHPFQFEDGRRGVRPSPWSESFWQVYLDASKHIEIAVQYVENNPRKEGMPVQSWPFVQSAPAQGPGLNRNC